MSKLIKLSKTHYVVVDDSEIKEGDKFIIEKTVGTNFFSILTANKLDEEVKDGRLKIIRSTQPLDKDIHGFGYWTKDIIPLSLSEVEEAIYGYSVEKMADEYSDFERESKWGNIVRNAYKAGFNARKELVKDKLFTVDDLRKAIDMARTLKEGSNEFEVENILGSSDGTYGIKQKYSENQIIESLLPKTEWGCYFDEQGKITIL